MAGDISAEVEDAIEARDVEHPRAGRTRTHQRKLLVLLYRVVNLVSTLMLWRWSHGVRVERTFVPIGRMASALPITVIAAEDGRYCRHIPRKQTRSCQIGVARSRCKP